MVLGLEMIEAANLDKRQRLSGPSMVNHLNKQRSLSVMVFLKGLLTITGKASRLSPPINQFPASYIVVSTRIR